MPTCESLFWNWVHTKTLVSNFGSAELSNVSQMFLFLYWIIHMIITNNVSFVCLVYMDPKLLFFCLFIQHIFIGSIEIQQWTEHVAPPQSSTSRRPVNWYSLRGTPFLLASEPPFDFYLSLRNDLLLLSSTTFRVPMMVIGATTRNPETSYFFRRFCYCPSLLLFVFHFPRGQDLVT